MREDKTSAIEPVAGTEKTKPIRKIEYCHLSGNYLYLIIRHHAGIAN
jgi:hypothetical protein